MAKALFRENSPKQLAWENSWLVSLCIDPGVLRISSDGDDRMGAKTKTQNDPKKIPDQNTCQIVLSKKIPALKISNPPKSFDLPRTWNPEYPFGIDPWRKTAEITILMRCVTTLIWVVPLTGLATRESCFKQSEVLPGLGSDHTPLVWNLCRHFSDIILQESQLWKLWQRDFSL